MSVPMWNRNRKPPGRLLRMVVLLALASFIAGCAPKKKVDLPVYREDPPGQVQPAPPAVTPPDQPGMQPEGPPDTGPEAAPEIPSKARIPPPPGQVGTLLAGADKAMQAGELDKAEMHLERALRLSPREAQLWHTMARVRFEQGNYAQAVQLCLKSNSLAGRNGAVVRRNWLLIEKAYLKTGEKEKAAQARQKAEETF